MELVLVRWTRLVEATFIWAWAVQAFEDLVVDLDLNLMSAVFDKLRRRKGGG